MTAQQDTSFARVTSLAAHDLRTPLATIFGFARTIQRSTELEPPVSRYVDMIVEASMQMTELLEKLALADCAKKHGGVPAVTLSVDGSELTLAPVNEQAAPVILGDDLRDLGAAV